MDNTELIAGLCAIIEQQNTIIKSQYMQLAQLGAIDAQEAKIHKAEQQYAAIMGERELGADVCDTPHQE